MKYVLALDQGTTSSRAILFDHVGTPVATEQREFAQHFPRPGWVEHEPQDIWQSQLATARGVIEKAGITPSDIAAIGIANQRETVVVWDRNTGEPIHNAIVWQDRRTSDLCANMVRNGLSEPVRAKTGLVIDAYFSGTKLRWLLDNVSGAREKASRGELAFGTIDSWLIHRLTGGVAHATDITNASRTMLFNIHEQQWDRDLLDMMDVPESVLPEVKSCSELYGKAHEDLFGASIPIAGVAGDQQAALLGNMCIEPGGVKTTYGTGCFMLLNTGSEAVASKSRLLTTIAWRIGNETTYALEGSVFIGGATVQWLRDGLGIIDKTSEVEALAASVPDTDGVVMVPAFAGLGAPHWDQYARGVIAGITRGTTKAHIARAALEGIAFQVADVLGAMRNDYGQPIKEMRVDGGASTNGLLMQFQADLIDALVVRPAVTETTALGAAYLAGLGVGVWGSVEALRTQWRQGRQFEPAMSREDAAMRSARWSEAVNRAGAWEQMPEKVRE